MSDSKMPVQESPATMAGRLDGYSSELSFWLNGERMVVPNAGPRPSCSPTTSATPA